MLTIRPAYKTPLPATGLARRMDDQARRSAAVDPREPADAGALASPGLDRRGMEGCFEELIAFAKGHPWPPADTFFLPASGARYDTFSDATLAAG